MIKMINLLRKFFSVGILVFSLLQNSFTSVVHAQATFGINANDVAQIASTAMGVYGQYLGQKQQTVMQQIQSQQNLALMQSLSPTCRKADGTPCFQTSGKFFPECPLPASMSNMPQNVCSNATPDVNQISQMITYEAIAKNWVNYYNQMSNKASNLASPIGLRCLEDKQRAVDSQITEMINNLTKLQDRLNKEKEVFRDANKKILDELGTTNDELFGSSGKNNLKIKTQDFSKFFSQSCQSALGKEAIQAGSQVGFNGLLQSMVSKNKAASDYNQNKAIIENDLRRDIERIQASINQNGISTWAATVEPSKIKSVSSAVVQHSKEFEVARNRIASELKTNFNYDLPAFDKNFSADIEEFSAGAKDFFKRQYINECVTLADRGVAIPIDQILASIEQRSTKNTGTARNDYRRALETILKSEDSAAVKLQQIKALEGTYKDITVTYKDSNSQKVIESPYNLFVKTVASCEQKYAQNDQFSSGSKGVSHKKKVERGQALINELKNIHNNFASNLGQTILERVLNCNGEVKKSGDACNEESLSQSSDNFCMAQANQCSNEIQGCYAEANTQVETRKKKMEDLSKRFNDNAAQLVVR